MPDEHVAALLAALSAEIAHLEHLVREFDDQHALRNQAIHARLGDLEDLILGERQTQAFTGHAQVPALGRVPLTLQRAEPPLRRVPPRDEPA
jgi:hypothetical protein